MGDRRLTIPLKYGNQGTLKGMLSVNDTFFLTSDTKRYVAVAVYDRTTKDGVAIPFVTAVALSGEDKGSVLIENFSPGYDGGLAEKMRFSVPVFYGKQAAKRYDQYVHYMVQQGNGDLVLPFESAESKPDQPEAALPPSDTETPDEADVILRHTVQDGTLALWDHAADRNRSDSTSIYHVVRKGGFVKAHVSGGGEYRRTNSVGLVETRAPVAWMVGELHRRGYTVYLDLNTGETAEAIRRKREYLIGRAERTDERAERKGGEAERRIAGASAQQEREKTRREIAGYFPTPDDLAERIVKMADIGPDMQVLEPSAGHGALVAAIRKAEPEAQVDAIEVNSDLRSDLRSAGIPVVAADVFDPSFEPGSLYDRIVMNPPFEDGAACEHVIRAWEFLAAGGRLVAIVPESVQYRQDKKHTAFRDWLSERGFTVEDTERMGFGRAGAIKTRVLVGEKPEEMPDVPASDTTLARITSIREDARRATGQRATAAESVREQRWARMRALNEAARKGSMTKAERSEQIGLQLAAKAEYTARRAKAIRGAAERVTATSVSKGGYGAVKPAKSTAPRRKHIDPPGFLTDFKALMRKIKGLTGAESVESYTPDGVGHRWQRWIVRWPGRVSRKITASNGRDEWGREDKPPYKWTIAREGYGVSPDAEGQLDTPDAALLFGEMVRALNADPLLQAARLK
jgi:hypothetical protein